MSKEKDDIEKLHPYGLKGIWEVYGETSFIKKPSFYVSVGIGVLLFVFCLLVAESEMEIYELIDKIVEIGISLDGGLIGLSLAGLTLIVTFGSEKLLKRIVNLTVEKAVKENKLPTFSGYQTAVSKFSFAVLIQILTLIVLVIYKVAMGFSFSFEEKQLNIVFNSLFLAIAIFLIFYSLFLVVQMTFNIFTISQMNHSVYLKESIDEFMEAEKKRKKDGEKKTETEQ